MVDQKQQVLNWLKAGAVWKDGVLLFRAFFGKQHPFITLIKKSGSQLKYQILKQSLTNYANSLPSENGAEPQQPKTKIREDWPFLANANCPAEFKVLIADKITAYHNYTSAYQKLFNCISNQDYYSVAAQVVENYIQNRQILNELDHYAKHKKPLGKHHVFKLFKRIEELKKMKVVELIKLKDKLTHNIWRINSEINKGDKPQLLQERLLSIKQKQQEITEIDRILERYA